MQPPQPVEQMPQPEAPRRMSVFQILLIAAVIGFVVWYLVTALTPDAEPYGRISAGTLGARYAGDCPFRTTGTRWRFRAKLALWQRHST